MDTLLRMGAWYDSHAMRAVPTRLTSIPTSLPSYRSAPSRHRSTASAWALSIDMKIDPRLVNVPR